MKKTIKPISTEDEFGNAQDELYRYIDWLLDTGRLTQEEHSKLLDSVTDCIMKAIEFGYFQ